MKILALDLATVTGWAINEPKTYGTWDLKIKKDESDGMRVIRFKRKLAEVLEACTPELVAFERPAGRNARGVITASELMGVVKTECIERGVQYRAYSASEIKLLATGKGNSGKPLVVAAAKEKLGYAGDDDNEADALWLLELAKRDYHLPF
jgi:Holliday junction resolvasome RuvABC endonuclease subunit